MSEKAFQDHYPDDVAHCYGCGRLNEHGLRIRSFWDGDETVARLRPCPHHTAVPGYVYGGLLASLIDCHATGSAAAAAYRAQSRGMDTDPPLRFLTASLSVDFIAPTPLNAELEARGRIEEVQGRKVVVSVSVRAGDLECARGRVVCVQVPDDFLAQLAKSR